MKADEVRQKYIDFFVARGHKQIPPAPLVPQDDPTTLFTSSGMQPLVPYLLGETHPKGKLLVNSQPSIRVQDIEEVGDNRHTTFFEMLGNWSLGDYFKQEQLPWIWEFLTKEINLPADKLWVTVFKGDSKVDKDTESIKIWKGLGIPKTKIHQYGVNKNWWSRSGTPEQMPSGEIGGPDSEVFYEFTEIKHDPKFGKTCHPNCECGRFLEIANSVFIQYKKNKDGSLEELPQQSVDFGGGLERLVAATNDNPDVFETDLFQPIIKSIQNVTAKEYEGENKRFMRVITDHIKAAVFITAVGVVPSNKQQGYVLRRLLRRATRKLRDIEPSVNEQDIEYISQSVFSIYENNYLSQNSSKKIVKIIGAEIFKFSIAIDKGFKQLRNKEGKQKLEKIIKNLSSKFSWLPMGKNAAKLAFDLYQTHGLSIDEFLSEFGKEFTIAYAYGEKERIKEAFEKVIEEEYAKLKTKHSEKSRTSSTGMFKGSLADKSEDTMKLHTATHLLHQSLRNILGDHVQQTGSNITGERLRFDFKHSQKLTAVEIKKVESLINQKIKQDLPVHKTIEAKDQALKSGALAFFKQKYPDQVSVYTIGKQTDKNWFSKELCGGPHVTSTGEIGAVKIIKEQSVGGGIRRIYAVLDK